MSVLLTEHDTLLSSFYVGRFKHNMFGGYIWIISNACLKAYCIFQQLKYKITLTLSVASSPQVNLNCNQGPFKLSGSS